MAIRKRLIAFSLSTVILLSQTSIPVIAEEQNPETYHSVEQEAVVTDSPEAESTILEEEPAAAEPMAEEAAAVEPAATAEPTTEEPAAAEPAATAEPTAEKPAAAVQPAATAEPAAAEPAAVQSAATAEPAAMEPAATAEEPAAMEPAATAEELVAAKAETVPVAEAIRAVTESKAFRKAKADTAPETGDAPVPAGETAVRKTRLAVLSDIHYVADQLKSKNGQSAISEAARTEIRLMDEIDTILSSALKEASETVPDVLLVCGDLLSNGEQIGARALADKLKAAKEIEGFSNTGFYVVNGNHDINNSYAADYTGESIQTTRRIQPEEFSDVFGGLGYGENDHYAGGTHSVFTPSKDNPDDVTNHGGLSYAATVAEGIRLIVLDTAVYRIDEEEKSLYNEAQQTGGYVSDELLAWAANEARQASAKGDLVLVMSHHGLIPHYDLDLEEKGHWYMGSTNIPNWEKVADTLADAGVTAVFTGHTHANDIAKHISKNNNVLYDIETAALCAYPCAWRTIDIETKGEGENRTYTFSIETKDVNVDPTTADTSKWTFTIGGETKSYAEDYNGNLQDYAYDKTGINEGLIDSAAMYNVKYMLYDVVRHEGGIAGYLREKLELPEDQTLGQWAQKSLVDLVNKNLADLTKSFSLFGTEMEINLKNNREKSTEDKPQMDVTLNVNGKTETGKLFLNLDYIPTAVNNLVSTIQKNLEEGDWMKDNYASAPLLDDVKKVLTTSLIPALNEPIEEGNPTSTAFRIINDGFLAFNRGDEGLADSATVEKRKHDRELLQSDKFADIVGKKVWNTLLTTNNKTSYPALAQLLAQPLVDADTKGILSLEKDDPSAIYMNMLRLFENIRTFSDVMNAANMFSSFADFNPLTKNMLSPVIDRVAGLHEVMTNDHNIPSDNDWGFHAVRFDANGGEVRQKHGLTVEGMKLVSLPNPEDREGYDFAGWFTEPSGGRQITLQDTMAGIHTLYAHWTAQSKPEPTITPTPDPKPTITPAPNPEPTVTPESAITQASDSENTAAQEQADEKPNLYKCFGYTRKTYNEAAKKQAEEKDYHKLCKIITDKIQKGETRIELGDRKMLCPEVVKAIEECNTDLFLVYEENNKGIMIRIPALADLAPFLNKDGTVYVFRLAEEFCYEWIR